MTLSAPGPQPSGHLGADDQEARYYLEERYARRPRSAKSLSLYYRLKPLLPRSLQVALRRRYARHLRRRHQTEQRFPRWPIEPVLVDRERANLRARLREAGEGGAPLVAPWPSGHTFAFVLTHDVEGADGLANVPRVLAVERRHGMVSSWNLVAEDYPIDAGVLDAIREAGGEIGLHGLSHDGRLFESRAQFERQLPQIQRYLRAWGAQGFRSPSTHRNADWMPELGCLYDSSFPDTDPFEPQPGGCCSIFPYFLGELVELPITLVQDHTLFEILAEPDIALWREKATWIATQGGLVTVLVHPDYMRSDKRLRQYSELLAFLAGIGGGWHALPRDVAQWWRRRAPLEAAVRRGEIPDQADLAASGASLVWARDVDGQVVFLPPTSPPLEPLGPG